VQVGRSTHRGRGEEGVPLLPRGLSPAPRRAFTLIELAVAVAVVAILGAVAYLTYMGQIANARTGALDQLLQQVHTAMLTYQANAPGAVFPVDAANANQTANTGEPSYEGLVQDLQGVGIAGFPPTLADAHIIASSWTYEPVNTTAPATFTIVAQAQGGNGHTLCVDALHGVVDLQTAPGGYVQGVTCR
jgi:prepilin-type N-terminal cleavage/methylation domain-containing protein